MPSKTGVSIKINPEEVMYSSMSKSKEGYNYASISAKRGENEYINIGYEWKGDGVPDFAMDLMSFLKANKETITASIESHSEELAEYAAKKGGKKMPPWMDEEETEDDMDNMTPEEKKAMKEKMKKKMKDKK